MKINWVFTFLFSALAAYAGPVQIPYIERQPEPADYAPQCAYMFPAGQPKEKVLAPGELDVRSCDISEWDLRDYTALELADVLTFDDKTVFPPKSKLPARFYPEFILQNGTNPGLHLRSLHEQGIDGRGISVAIIDQNLLTTHRDYRRSLVWYQEVFSYKDVPASMYGTAAASILVGRRGGIAPRARLFYFAAQFAEKNGHLDAMPIVDALEQIIDLNTKLPPDIKIRVVSIASGFGPEDNGFEAFTQTVRKLSQSGVAVFTMRDVYPLSRIHAIDHPDFALRYCRPANWLAPDEYDKIYDRATLHRRLLVPTDYRTVASATDDEEYVHFASSDASWGVPFVAGIYTLALQLNPTLTKREFIHAWRESAVNDKCLYNDHLFEVYNFANPLALLKKVQSPAKTDTEEDTPVTVAEPPARDHRHGRSFYRPRPTGKSVSGTKLR